jgi:hypothetical protein
MHSVPTTGRVRSCRSHFYPGRRSRYTDGARFLASNFGRWLPAGFPASPVGKEQDMTDNERQIQQDREELDTLQHEIDDVRRKADPDASDKPRYVDSGTIGGDEDDQTIVPPG